MPRLSFSVILLVLGACNTLPPLKEPADSPDAADDAPPGPDVQFPPADTDGPRPDLSVVPDGGGTDDVGDACPNPQAMDAIGISAVCMEGVAASAGTSIAHRVRVASNGIDFVAAFLGPTGVSLTKKPWDEMSSWQRPSAFDPNLMLNDGDPTAAAVGFLANEPLWVVTRRSVTNCADVRASTGDVTTIQCDDSSAALYAAEITNLSDVPHYFWFDGTSGSISAMRWDSTARGGEQLLVPWCVGGAGGCESLDFGLVEARGNDGPHVLLSDATGRAYLWDTTQLQGARAAEVDCSCPSEAPIPLELGAEPLLFADVDVVFDGSNYHLLRQTNAAVEIRPLVPGNDPGPTLAEIPNSGRRPMFSAAIEGNRIAVLSADATSWSIYGFDGSDYTTFDGGPLTGQTINGMAIAIKGADVGVAMAATMGNYVNKITIW